MRPAEEGGSRGRAVRIGVVALGEIPGPAVRAVSAGDGRGNHHAISRLEVADVGPDLLDDPDGLVPEDRAWLHARHRAADHVQVRAADARAGDANQGVVGVFDRGLRNIIETDLANIVINDRFHSVLLAFIETWTTSLRSMQSSRTPPAAPISISPIRPARIADHALAARSPSAPWADMCRRD